MKYVSLFLALLTFTLPCLGLDTPEILSITLNPNDSAQTIRNIGASGCWYSEAIGRYWPQEKRQRIAELLFSRELDESGSPKGIGISAWRFNIGGGTAEQGEQSGIGDPSRRVECFLNAGGHYDWDKQAGYRWFVQQAKDYGVETLIAFSNTPPIFWTQNGRGYKTTENGVSNLHPDQYQAFAEFLVRVMQHFDEQGLHFDLLSPVNEPQWDWYHDPNAPAKQEGCPWTNGEIYQLVQALNTTFAKHNLTTRLLLPEAASLEFLVQDKLANRSKLIETFWNPQSDLYLGNFQAVAPYVAGHSYFTDNGDEQLIAVRQQVAEAIAQRGQPLEFWQSEYCLLGDGFRDGKRRWVQEMDCALFLAKVIHHDLTVGQATAWHFWNAYEPGRARQPRYYLIALQPNRDGKDGSFTPTKNLWALGHYSRFIRPGMQRLVIQRSDNATVQEAARGVMVSAYRHPQTGQGAVVIINYRAEASPVKLNIPNITGSVTRYVTTSDAQQNMSAESVASLASPLTCPARSITTLVF